jgi:hypothetical protein
VTADNSVPPDKAPMPHAVSPGDERRHTPDPDDLWNESYYCDFVNADGSVGGWLRVGLYPNRQVAWWTTWIVFPDRPGLCSVDYQAPVPPGDSLVSEPFLGDGRVEIDLVHPLEDFRLAATTPARTIADPADVYAHGEQTGSPAALSLDLTWSTNGVPYHYDVTTRYEIPCTVSGTLTVDGETRAIEGQGQRDHSWGVRDWWAFGWCWCSLRLDDGTRVHAVDIRMLPDVPVFFGYVQAPGQPGTPYVVHPLSALTVTEELGEHGFPRQGRIDLEAGANHRIGIDLNPVAFGPVLLRDNQHEAGARSSRFPRAWISCRTDDGRAGAGWIEWNQPDSPPAPPAA